MSSPKWPFILISLYIRVLARICQAKGGGNLGNLRLKDAFLEFKTVFEGGFKFKNVVEIVDCIGWLGFHPVVPDEQIDDFT